MVSHAAAIMARFPAVRPSVDFIVSSADGVQTIDRWDAAAIGHPSPTAEDLAEWALLVQPPPRWVEFGAAVLFHPSIREFAAANVVDYPALVLAFGQAAQGDRQTLMTLWPAMLQAGIISPELAEAVADLGAGFDLPADFLAALNPSSNVEPS